MTQRLALMIPLPSPMGSTEATLHEVRVRPKACPARSACSRYRQGARRLLSVLEHDPEKAWPGLDPGWTPVFGKDHASTIGWRDDYLKKVILLSTAWVRR
jgi:hypothetical protein